MLKHPRNNIFNKIIITENLGGGHLLQISNFVQQKENTICR